MMSSQPAQAAFDIRRPAALACRLKVAADLPVGRIIPIFEEEYCNESAMRDVLAHRFSFNGETYDLGEEMDWLANPSRDIEWHILLHKFYYAPGLARAFGKTNDDRYKRCFDELIQSWIEQTPVDFIAPDVTARRVQNWIYAWRLFRQHNAPPFSRQLQDEFLNSLVEQVDYVCANLTRARNHRTLELYSIFLASVAMPDMDRGGRWRKLSVAQMLRNIDSDLLGDGVHCELSTDYHHIVLRSYLLFFRLAEMHDIDIPQKAAGKICLALDFAMHVHRPDGNIPALSDSDSRSFLELLRWGSRLFGRQDYAFVASQGATGKLPDEQHRIFADGGYALLRSPWRNGERFSNARYLAFDCGDIGAGNHGHLDALSIELAAYGQPLIVDPGRYTYDEGGGYNWRAHFRQTSAHNTVTINRCNQAIYRQHGPKRKILDPRPTSVLVGHELHDDMAYLHGTVTSPNYEALHQRHIWFVDNRYWVVLDRLCAVDEHGYELRYQLTPGALGHVQFSSHRNGTEVNAPGLTLFIAQPTPAVTEERGFVSRQYGEKEAAPNICARSKAADYEFLSVLYPTLSSSPRIHARGTTDNQAVSIFDQDRRDSWEWNRATKLMMHRSSGSVQTWRLGKASDNG